MKSLSDLKLKDFEAALTPQDVRGLQILHAAFTLGPTLFFGVVAAIHLTGALAGNGGGDPDVMPILMVVLAAVSLGAYGAAVVMVRLVQFGDARLAAAVPPPGEGFKERAAGECMNLIRGALILQTALLEGPALFGIVLVLVASMFGDLESQPLYWLGATPAAILLLYMAAAFPTAERLKRLFVRRIKREEPDFYRGD